MVLWAFTAHFQLLAQDGLPEKGDLIYESSLSNREALEGWIMEGPGELEFKDRWMQIYAPKEQGHHVYWSPAKLPASFIATWELQNLNTDAGLCIVFFAAEGNNGEDIFDASFPRRDGVFKQYTKSKYFNNYHISYYANTKDTRSKEVAHLRKNSGFNKVQVGEPGIPISSKAIHRVTLVKDKAEIRMFIDDRKVIDWIDDGQTYGSVLSGGRIGFRQMKWTRFQYRNLKIWEVDS